MAMTLPGLNRTHGASASANQALCARLAYKSSSEFGPDYPSHSGIGSDAHVRKQIIGCKGKGLFHPNKQEAEVGVLGSKGRHSTVTNSFILSSNCDYHLMVQDDCSASPQFCFPAWEEVKKGMPFTVEAFSRSCTCHVQLCSISRLVACVPSVSLGSMVIILGLLYTCQ